MVHEQWRSLWARLRPSIAVWGPAPRKGSSGQKRLDIREELTHNGHDAYFPEDVPAEDAGNISVNAQELLQVADDDLVVNFAASPGSQGEFHEFALVLKERQLTWFHEGARKAYAGLGLAQQLRLVGGDPMYYRDEDVQSCVIALASADWVEQMVALWATEKELAKKHLDRLPPRVRRELRNG